MTIDILFLTLLWVSIGYVTALFADGRGRSMSIWFILGMLFGLFALGALFLLPSLKNSNGKNESIDPKVDEVNKENVADYDFEWFYLDRENVQKGPIDFEDLCIAWHDGVVTSDTYVWYEGMENWKLIGENEMLMKRLADSSP